MERTSRENQLITLMVNALFNVVTIYLAYSFYNFIVKTHPASDPMIKIMVYIMTWFLSLAMIIVVIQEPEGAAFMTQHDEKSVRLSSVLSFLTIIGIIITTLFPTFITACLSSLPVIAASVFFLIIIIKDTGEDVSTFKQVRATSRLFMWTKHIAIMLTEWVIVPIKMYTLNFFHSNSLSFLSFLLTFGLYLTIVIINVNIVFNLFEKSRWYDYRYEREKTKEPEFRSEVDEKTYNAVAEDYHWAFINIAPIVAANTVALFFIML